MARIIPRRNPLRASNAQVAGTGVINLISGNDPYPYYPAFDRTLAPWHAASGAWGAQVPLQFPAEPVTTRNVTVNSTSEFNSQAAIPGTRITIGTSFSETSGVAITANDIDVILPAGRVAGLIELGAWPRTTPHSRVRVWSGTYGVRGGRFGQWRDFDLASDIIIADVDVNGSGQFVGGGEGNNCFRPAGNRYAFLRVRALAPNHVWLGSARHVFIGGSGFYAGAITRAQAPYVEGWCIRNSGGPITIWNSRIQTTRYAVLRAQSVGSAGECLYVGGNSSIFALAEGRPAWLWDNLGQGPWEGQAAIFDNVDIYAYTIGGCAFGFGISASDVLYSRIRNSRIYSGGQAVTSQAAFNATISGINGDHNWAENNQFFPLSGPEPGWPECGDPRLVPLPSLYSALPIATGESPCFGYVWGS